MSAMVTANLCGRTDDDASDVPFLDRLRDSRLFRKRRLSELGHPKPVVGNSRVPTLEGTHRNVPEEWPLSGFGCGLLSGDNGRREAATRAQLSIVPLRTTAN